jgi:hypothetical protein
VLDVVLERETLAEVSVGAEAPAAPDDLELCRVLA